MACLFTGTFAADVIGLLIGYLLKARHRRESSIQLHLLFFHLWNPDAETGIWPSAWAGSSMILPLTVAVTVVFVIVCLVLYKQAKKN